MSPICSSILFPILLALFCDAYPAFDSEDLAPCTVIEDVEEKSYRRGIQEMNNEKLGRFLDQYEELRSNNLDVDSKGGKLPNLIKEAWNRSGMKSKETPEEFGYDDAMEKRGPLKGKYHYYKCYFNPVTCYGK